MLSNKGRDMHGDPYDSTRAQLAGTAFEQIRYVSETVSTNDDAAALLGTPGAPGLTIVAEHQSRGSGRKGRTWLAKPGSALLFTTILPEPLATDALWSVPFWAALALRHALENHGIDAMLQWPNDLLLGDRKLAGILSTSRISGDRAWVACGVGVNVYRTPEADALIDPPAAFCSDVTAVDRAQMLANILRACAASLASLREPRQVAREWQRQALPARYRILRDGESEPFEGRAIALEPDGSLTVERENGVRERVSLADARVVR